MTSRPMNSGDSILYKVSFLTISMRLSSDRNSDHLIKFETNDQGSSLATYIKGWSNLDEQTIRIKFQQSESINCQYLIQLKVL